MTSKHYATALRTRLHLPHPTPNASCQHHNAQRTCTAQVDRRGRHAEACPIGGYSVQTHDAIRDALAAWLHALGFPFQTEQRVPALDTPMTDGTTEHAILDITTTIHGTPYYIDITVTTAHTTDPDRARKRAQTDGAAATERENYKQRRYGRHPNLVPFVLEGLGRWGHQAHEFVRRVAPEDPAQRSAHMAQLRHTLATVLQRGRADALIASHGL